MFERPTRPEVLAALRAAGVGADADLAEIAAAARRLGFELALDAFDGLLRRGRAAVLHRATVGRGGSPVGVAFSSASERAAAVEALGRALLYERRQAGRRAWQPGDAGDAEGGSPPH